MEFLIIAVVVVLAGYFGYQYYLVKKTTIEPCVEKAVNTAKEAAAKVDVEKVLDVNKDGKVDINDVTIIADQATKAVDTAKKTVKQATKKDPAKKTTTKKKPNIKIVK